MLDLYTNLSSRSAQTLQGWGYVPPTDRDQVYLQRQAATSAILHEAHKTSLGLETLLGFQSLRSGSTIPPGTLSTCSPQNHLQRPTLPACLLRAFSGRNIQKQRAVTESGLWCFRDLSRERCSAARFCRPTCSNCQWDSVVVHLPA